MADVAGVRPVVRVGGAVGKQLGAVVEDAVADGATVLGQVRRAVALVRVHRLDDFAAQLARVERLGLVLVAVVAGHLAHRAADERRAQLTLPALVGAATEEQREHAPVLALVDQFLQPFGLAFVQLAADALAEIFQRETRGLPRAVATIGLSCLPPPRLAPFRSDHLRAAGFAIRCIHNVFLIVCPFSLIFFYRVPVQP